LPLLGNYTNVKPRRPKGGPDGARDIEAEFASGTPVWGAVGFRVNANDSREDKSWVKKKFRDDLAAALDGNASLKGFVFLTNIDLEPAEVAELTKHAHDAGIEHVEIFYRERLRIVLDDARGLAYRFQFLGIELSSAEQAAFFTQFGSDFREEFNTRLTQVEKSFNEGLDALRSDLEREKSQVKNDLLQLSLEPEMGQRVRTFKFVGNLSRPCDIRHLEAFPFMCEVVDDRHADGRFQLLLCFDTLIRDTAMPEIFGKVFFPQVFACALGPWQLLDPKVVAEGVTVTPRRRTYVEIERERMDVMGEDSHYWQLSFGVDLAAVDFVPTFEELARGEMRLFLPKPLAAFLDRVTISANDIVIADLHVASIRDRFNANMEAYWPTNVLKRPANSESWDWMLIPFFHSRWHGFPFQMGPESPLLRTKLRLGDEARFGSGRR
jgi:hypothetical protein